VKTAAVLRGVREKLDMEIAPEITAVPLRRDGGLQVGAIPPRAPHAGLCFHDRATPPPAGMRAQAAALLRGSGLAALVGTVVSGDGGTDLPEFNIARLKSEDYIPIESLWVGPAAARTILDRLDKDPAMQPYEIALIVANSGPVDAAPELRQPRLRNPVPRLGARHGERLSRRYFGMQDPAWLSAVGHAGAYRLPLGTRLSQRFPALHRQIASLIASVYRWRTTGQRPGFQRLLAGLLPTRSAPPGLFSDGWMGRRAEIVVQFQVGQPLHLTVESPVWPLPQPPQLRVRLLGTTIYDARITRRGSYQIIVPWPPEAEGGVPVSLECDQTFTPSECGLGPDSRAISLRVLPSAAASPAEPRTTNPAAIR
jgi:hypothetical protein